ncbi:MAG: cation:proton antiporter [Candidatus Diapherotrites archaeon]|nr:cation:proton antiporter [Candidatus Diapherotrites archaeon]
MPVNVVSMLFFFGIVVFLGYLGHLLFKRTRIPDSLILIIVGLLAGPIFGILDSNTISVFKNLTPLLATLTLITLLFEGGLNLNFYYFLQNLTKSSGFTLLVFLLTVAVSTGFFIFLGWTPIIALMISGMVAGTTSAVMAIINETRARKDTKILLTLEAIITDAFSAVVVLTAIELFLAKSVDVSQIFQSILGSFSIAAVIALVLGIFWLHVLQKWVLKGYEFIMTFGVSLLLFAFVEFSKGSGAIAALVFGLVLGNGKEISHMFKMKSKDIDGDFKIFQAELSFFIRSFFFINLGIIFDLKLLTFDLALITLALLGLMFFVRIIGSKILVHFVKEYKQDEFLLQVLTSKGMAAAALATYPLSIGLPIGEFGSKIVSIISLLIIFSNIFTFIGIFLYERKKQKQIDGKNNNHRMYKLIKRK